MFFRVRYHRLSLLVSVIIPVYNGEKYIRQAIDSALNQTIKREKYEIIVSDDASNDSTPTILKEYEDKIKIVTSKINRGTACSLNRAIRASKGEWIKWLSADDEMLPDCLEILLDYACMSDCIYYTHYHIIDQYGTHISDFVEPGGYGRPKEDLWKEFFGNGSSSLIHRDTFKECGLFDGSLRFGEDYEFWLRVTMLHHGEISLIPEFTINYRNHPEQLSGKVGGRNDIIIKERIKGRITAS